MANRCHFLAGGNKKRLSSKSSKSSNHHFFGQWQMADAGLAQLLKMLVGHAKHPPLLRLQAKHGLLE
jgi:hypothetical protein